MNDSGMSNTVEGYLGEKKVNELLGIIGADFVQNASKTGGQDE